MNRKDLIISMMILIFVLFCGWQEGFSGFPPVPGQSYEKTDLPDLTATVKFAKVEPYTNSKGIQCYAIRPFFTYTNQGKNSAKNFDVLIEWNYNPSHTWQMFTGKQNETLGPGQTRTIDGNNPTWNLPWCVNETGWKPGWRITVDSKKTVAESNEGNNVAEKIFIPLTMPKTEPPKAIKKELIELPMKKK